jgi:hypothetical protein
MRFSLLWRALGAAAVALFLLAGSPAQADWRGHGGGGGWHGGGWNGGWHGGGWNRGCCWRGGVFIGVAPPYYYPPPVYYPPPPVYYAPPPYYAPPYAYGAPRY